MKTKRQVFLSISFNKTHLFYPLEHLIECFYPFYTELINIDKLIMNGIYGKYHDDNAQWKHSPKDALNRFRNGITRRSRETTERTVSPT